MAVLEEKGFPFLQKQSRTIRPSPFYRIRKLHFTLPRSVRIWIKRCSADIHLSLRHYEGETHGNVRKKIVDTNVEDLVKLLNKVFSDEWLAYYQYGIGSKVVRGLNKEAVIAEPTLHATEELGHAVLLVTRIIQLGGTPVTKPEDWYKHQLRVRCSG